MYIRKPTEYIVNISYNNMDTLINLDNSIRLTSEDKFIKVKKMAIVNSQYFYLKVKDVIENLSSKDISKIHMNHFKDIYMTIAKTLSCFDYIKGNGINGRSFNELVDMHSNIFSTMYSSHFDSHKCEEKISVLDTAASELQMSKLEPLSQLFQEMFTKLKDLTSEMTKQQSLSIYIAFFESTMKMHNENVECFNNSLVKSYSSSEKKQLTIMHLDRVTDLIKVHEELLKCDYII